MKIAPVALTMLFFTGCISRPTGGVSLTLTSVAAKREPTMLTLFCDAVLENQTGAALTVSSHFFSAFDGLSLVVRDDRDRLLTQVPKDRVSALRLHVPHGGTQIGEEFNRCGTAW